MPNNNNVYNVRLDAKYVQILLYVYNAFLIIFYLIMVHVLMNVQIIKSKNIIPNYSNIHVISVMYQIVLNALVIAPLNVYSAKMGISSMIYTSRIILTQESLLDTILVIKVLYLLKSHNLLLINHINLILHIIYCILVNHVFSHVQMNSLLICNMESVNLNHIELLVVPISILIETHVLLSAQLIPLELISTPIPLMKLS